MNYKDNFTANFLYIVIGLLEEYNQNKGKNEIKARSAFCKRLGKVCHEYGFPGEENCQFDNFIENMIKEFQEDFSYIKKNKIAVNSNTVEERFKKLIDSYTEKDILNRIKEFQSNYPKLFDGEESDVCEIKLKAFRLLEVSRNIEDFCEKMKDIENEFKGYTQQIWDNFLTDINNYTQGDNYNLIVHSMKMQREFFNECKHLHDWIEKERKNKFLLCASLITNKSHKIYHFDESSHIAGYGFVLKMYTNRLASISKEDNYTNYSFSEQSTSEYRKKNTNYFKNIITNIDTPFSFDFSSTKVPEQLNINSDKYNEIVFNFTENDSDLIIGVFCMLNERITKNETDDKFITALESFASKCKLKFIVLNH